MSSNEVGYGLVRSTSFGRKRVALTNVTENFGEESTFKRQCNVNSFPIDEKSRLESLPQDVLVKVLCGVNHDDLKSLCHVSNSIKEAAMVAKELHFEYSTPRKPEPVGFRSVADIEELIESMDIEAPNAPKQSRIRRSVLSRKKLSSISVALFASDDDENWPRRVALMGMDKEM